jgi:hypothetical protein
MAGGSDYCAQRGSAMAESKPKDMFSMWTGRPFYEGVPLEEVISRTLPHFLRMSLEGILSSVPRET